MIESGYKIARPGVGELGREGDYMGGWVGGRESEGGRVVGMEGGGVMMGRREVG